MRTEMIKAPIWPTATISEIWVDLLIRYAVSDGAHTTFYWCGYVRFGQGFLCDLRSREGSERIMF